MCLRRFFRYFVCMLLGAAAGYCLYAFVGCPKTACAILSNPVSSVGFMTFAGWLTALGFRENENTEDRKKASVKEQSK